MRIPVFCADAGRSLLIRNGTDKQAIRTIQILGYLITKEIYSGLTQNITKVAVIHELPLRKNNIFDHILRKSCYFQGYTLVYRLIRFVLVNKPIGLNADNLQPALHEVFHVCS